MKSLLQSQVSCDPECISFITAHQIQYLSRWSKLHLLISMSDVPPLRHKCHGSNLAVLSCPNMHVMGLMLDVGVSGASEPSQSHGDSWQGETWGEPHSASSQSGAQLIQASASAPSVRFISREAGKFARPAAPFAVVNPGPMQLHLSQRLADVMQVMYSIVVKQ